MRSPIKMVLPLCLVAGLAGCYGEGGYGYSGVDYYGDYAPSYGIGFTYYGGDNYRYGYQHWAPRNDWHWHGNGGGNYWRWHSAGTGRGSGHH